MECSTPASMSITNSWSVLKLMSFKLGMPSNHHNLHHPLLIPPSIFPSIKVFSKESVFPSGHQSIEVSASARTFCCCSVNQLCPTLCDRIDSACQASLSYTISQSLFKLMSIDMVMPPNNLIFCHPLLLLTSVFPSVMVFSNESDLHIRWPKYWNFSFSISPSKEQTGRISFRMDWLDLLAVQGTLKSLLQHHSSEASVLWPSAFFIVQLSHPHMTIGKTIALTR